MCKSVLVLALLLLGMKGLGAFSLMDCVCNADQSVCGLVVTILDESVIIFSENERVILSNDVANTADDPTLCVNSICGGNCVCTVRDTTFYEFEGPDLVPGQAIAAGTCYRAFGYPLVGPPTSGVDIFDVVTDPVPEQLVYRLIDRSDTILDPTGAKCDPGDCPADPVSEPGSSICTAVFPGSATITKGKYNDRCYYGVDLSCKYQEARDFCETVGLHLVWVETVEEGQIVAGLTGFDEYWIGLERPLFSRYDWMWVSTGLPVDADADVGGRFEGPRLTRLFNRAVVKRNDAGEYPLRATFRWVKKNFVCEEAVRCSGAKVTATVSFAIVLAYIAGKLM